MFATIKGVYDQGIIILSEEPPVHSKTNVMITFLSQDEDQNNNKKKGVKLGLLKGKIKLSDNFNDTLSELNEYM